MNRDEKRVFFAFEVSAPWPSKLPKGRILESASRHLTLAFLGNVGYPKLQSILHEFPIPTFKVGSTGIFDHCLLLPERHPHVVAWHVKWLEDAPFNAFQKQIAEWLRNHDYFIDERPFLPHVTIARSPFHADEWMKAFTPLPMMIHGIHLYESIGNLVYQPIWSYPLESPFVELDHTADLAFLIQAESIDSLHLHAQTALLFKYPALVSYMNEAPLKNSLDDIIIALNALITRADSEVGCPLKAVSFHGDLREADGILKWEMIVDV